MKEIVLATHNDCKIKEIQALLPQIHCIPQKSLKIPSVNETKLSFIENAILKARHATSHGHKPSLADDSGLVVPALHGQPGIYSARYAGIGASDQDNRMLLLEKMKSIPDENRQAYFYCALALVNQVDDPTPIIATGFCSGYITHEPIGQHGFGYDPIFYIPAYKCTFAQLTMKIKNKISHRAKALQQLVAILSNVTQVLPEATK